MKKNLSFFFVVLFVFLARTNGQQINCKDEPTNPLEIHQLTVKKEEAIRWLKKYRDKEWDKNKRFPVVGKKYDGRAVWFDSEKLLGLLCYAKRYRDSLVNKGSTIGEISGLRFYYMVYDKKTFQLKDASHIYPKEYKKVHSLLIVPTTQEMEGGQIYHKDLLIFSINKDDGKEYVTALTTVENNGTVCPPLPAPNCKGTLLMAEADKK